ncbi:macro domain-containing protein [Salinibacter sp.]|uniref:macro domain-containing protein n=1 Tax=Salinibacter sp. TaxID=2065818 RepID=UPI0021E7609C|nr:macro domain-containing protein [Salinibacter sp.]
MTHVHAGVTVELTTGNIAKQSDVEAVVNAANAQLRTGYENALRQAEENTIASVAFPALSTGAFGYPLDEAARIALETILDAAPDLDSVTHVRFVLFDETARSVHEKALSAVRDETGP